MTLVAQATLECTHRYDNKKRGVVYSVRLFNELPPRYSHPLATIVVHDPPEAWVSVAAGKAELDDDSRSPNGDIWIIQGLFCFHSRRGPNQVPVLHANPMLKKGDIPNAVFLRCSNRSSPTSDIRYTVSVPNPEDEAEVFIDNHGPEIRRPSGGSKKKYFSNSLLGVIPLGTIVHQDWWSLTHRVPFISLTHVVNPETGALECRGES